MHAAAHLCLSLNFLPIYSLLLETFSDLGVLVQQKSALDVW